MTTPSANLDALSDEDLSRVFALEFAGWRSHESEDLCYDPEGFIHFWAGLPTFATDTSSVESYLKKQFVARAHWGQCAGMTECMVEVKPTPDCPTLFAGHGPGMARAGCLALIRCARARKGKS